MNSFLKVTYILISYNQSEYIEEAVLSALNQSYNNIEFIFSDDASKDGTFEIMKKVVELNSDGKNCILNKNNNNLGLVQHINKCLELASGDIFCLAAGDDIALLNRVKKTVDIFNISPKIMGLSFNDLFFEGDVNYSRPLVDIKNDLEFSLENAFEMPTFSGASRAFRRDVYDFFGPLKNDCQTEDSTFLFRCLLYGKCILLSSSGVLYRWHGKNISNRSNIRKLSADLIFKQYFRDLEKAYENKLLNENEYKELQGKLKYNKKLRDFNYQDDFFKKIYYAIKLFLTEKKFIFKTIDKFKKIF